MIYRQKITSLVLLSICTIALLLPLFIYLPIQLIKTSQRKAIQSYSAHDARLTKIILSEDDYARLIHTNDDEFVYNNVLYDIKSVSKQKGNYIIEAIADTKEMHWNELRNNLIPKHGHKTNTKSFVFMFLFFENLKPPGFLNHILHNSFPKAGMAHLIQYYESIPSPPPDSIV